MRMNRILILAALGASLSLTMAWAQSFSSGSDGSYGALNITHDTTLDIPPSGIFNCTTISVAPGSTLTFNRNLLNTPVYLLATGDITIQGVINVSGGDGNANPPVGGLGGPGGYDGGSPGASGVDPGAGYGPGAGLPGDNAGLSTSPGSASYGSGSPDHPGPQDGATYGSALLIPLVGGSGGGGLTGSPGVGGGGGGGAILLASSTKVDVTGNIYADGGRAIGFGGWGHGSGGAIRIVAPVVSGNGGLHVPGQGWGSKTGGAGRIRIDTMNRSQLNVQYEPNNAGVVTTGSFMIVFPKPLPRLDIIQALGEAIPEGSPDPVLVTLPLNAPASQTVTVQARDFTGLVPIVVVVTPDSGKPATYPAQIDMSKGNPATVAVTVQIPANTAVHVDAWTK